MMAGFLIPPAIAAMKQGFASPSQAWGQNAAAMQGDGFTLEQQKALALASARKRIAEGPGQPASQQPYGQLTDAAPSYDIKALAQKELTRRAAMKELERRKAATGNGFTVGQSQPIEVDLPDGSIAEFPAGTSQDVMKSALQKRFPVPQGQASPSQPSTYEEIMAKSRELYNGGDIDGAKRLARIALDRKKSAEPSLDRLEQALRNADAAGDTYAAKRFADEIRARQAQPMPDYAAQAAKLDPTDLSIARSKNDAFGAYLRGEAQRPVAGETPEARDARLYGNPMAGPSKFQSGMAGVADMAGMGFADEMAAGIQSLTGPETYSQALSANRETMDILQRENPGSYLAGQVAGTLPLALATGGASAGQGMLGRMATGSAIGAGQGAAYGFGSGEGGFVPRMTDAATGAAFGGLIGGVAPAAIQGVSAIGGKIGQAIKGFAGADSFAESKIAQAARQAGMTADDFTARMSQAGPDAMMLDSLGEAGRRLGRTVADRGGQGADELLNATMQRQASHADRITGALAKELGDPNAFYGTLDDVTARLKTAAKPLYDKAFQTQAAMTPELDALAKRIPAPAIKQAQQIAAAEGKRLDAMPLVQRMDYMKRGLDDLIRAEDGKGAAGGFSDYGRALVGLKNNVLAEVDNIAPDYAAARKVFSDDLSLKRALESGRKAISADPELTARTMAGMTEGEKELFRIGVSRELSKQIGNRSTDTADAIRKVWTPNRRAMLETVFGSREGFERFAGQIAKEQEASATYAALHGGSKTARYMSDAGQGGLDGETALRAGTGDIRGAIRRALAGFGAKTGGMSETSATKIARLLMGNDADSINRIAGRMGKVTVADQKRAAIASALTQIANQNPDTRLATGLTAGGAVALPFMLGANLAGGARNWLLSPLAGGAR